MDVNRGVHSGDGVNNYFEADSRMLDGPSAGEWQSLETLKQACENL